MNNSRNWIFRVLVLCAAAAVVVSFLTPWWTLNIEPDGLSGIEVVKDPVRIYAYGFRHDLAEFADMVKPHETPLYQTVIAFIFLGASVLLMLYSTWLKGNKGRILLGSLGLVYLAYPVGTYLLISTNVKELGYPVQGLLAVRLSIISTTFTPMYYAVYGIGAALIVLALVRNLLAPNLRR